MTTLVMAAQQQGGSSMGFLVMMVLIFVVMWFFMIRPQQKRQKEIRNFQNSIKAGTNVVTGGGVHGVVRKVILEKNAVEVEIARGVIITVDKNYVFASAEASQMQAK